MDKIEQLRDEVASGYITNISELQGVEEPYENILSPLELNSCDRCGEIERTDDLLWTDYLDSEEDRAVLDEADRHDWTALCNKCYKQLKENNK